MAAPAEIPHADEALKTLVQRFKAAPGSAAFTELAAALLARGHAAEALRITEHGLQLVPGSVEGRVQRAAALIAQGRPRMAYVELLRALAIEPHHRRAQRLLGKAYVDAGAPERAAALLARRSKASPPASPSAAPTSNLAAALISDLTDEVHPAESAWRTADPTQADIPDLFSALTKDLGLGAAVPESPQRRVEVTQIIRRKARPRPPRSASELAEIDGPIVDTTQPYPAIHAGDEPAPTVSSRATVPLFTANPDLASLSLDDEPLFQEHMPFAVRPVNSPSEDLKPVDPRGATVRTSEEKTKVTLPRGVTEPESRGPIPSRDQRGPVPFGDQRGPGPFGDQRGPGPFGDQRGPGPFGDQRELSRDDSTDPTARGFDGSQPRALAPPPGGAVRSPPPVGLDSHRRRTVRNPQESESLEAHADRADTSRHDMARFDGSGPIVERNRTQPSRRLEVEAPPMNRGRLALGLLVALLMIGYFVVWIVMFKDKLSVWWTD